MALSELLYFGHFADYVIDWMKKGKSNAAFN